MSKHEVMRSACYRNHKGPPRETHPSTNSRTIDIDNKHVDTFIRPKQNKAHCIILVNWFDVKLTFVCLLKGGNFRIVSTQPIRNFWTRPPSQGFSASGSAAHTADTTPYTHTRSHSLSHRTAAPVYDAHQDTAHGPASTPRRSAHTPGAHSTPRSRRITSPARLGPARSPLGPTGPRLGPPWPSHTRLHLPGPALHTWSRLHLT